MTKGVGVRVRVRQKGGREEEYVFSPLSLSHPFPAPFLENPTWRLRLKPRFWHSRASRKHLHGGLKRPTISTFPGPCSLCAFIVVRSLNLKDAACHKLIFCTYSRRAELKISENAVLFRTKARSVHFSHQIQ